MRGIRRKGEGGEGCRKKKEQAETVQGPEGTSQDQKEDVEVEVREMIEEAEF